MKGGCGQECDVTQDRRSRVRYHILDHTPYVIYLVIHDDPCCASGSTIIF